MMGFGMADLMQIHEIRLKNARDLMKESGLSRTDFAEKVGLSYNLISQYIGKNPTKNIGDETASKIEEAFGKPKGFLDQANAIAMPLDAALGKGSIQIAPIEFRGAEGSKKYNVRIPVYRDVKASCGSGIENFLEDPSEYLDIDPSLLRILGIQAKPENLRVIYSDEYSMWPTVAPDSPLFIDVADKDPGMLKSGSVYVFKHNYELRMKRIFISYAGGTTVRLASDNPDKIRYPDEFITNEQLNEIDFIGRLESALVKP